ncbi:hypothetical protein Paride_0405 [Pseudomonas phage Paride]|nr:hypothetical protein Paride_0405 [Pseudomonas phage Paride]
MRILRTGRTNQALLLMATLASPSPKCMRKAPQAEYCELDQYQRSAKPDSSSACLAENRRASSRTEGMNTPSPISIACLAIGLPASAIAIVFEAPSR